MSVSLSSVREVCFIELNFHSMCTHRDWKLTLLRMTIVCFSFGQGNLGIQSSRSQCPKLKNSYGCELSLTVLANPYSPLLLEKPISSCQIVDMFQLDHLPPHLLHYCGHCQLHHHFDLHNNCLYLDVWL